MKNNLPPGGSGKLRALLDRVGVPVDSMETHPLYQEGYDDGRADAHDQLLKLFEALAAVYQIDLKP